MYVKRVKKTIELDKKKYVTQTIIEKLKTL